MKIYQFCYCCRLIDLTTRHRQETEMETERLRSAQIQAERMLEARERAHRQRVKGLEEQVQLHSVRFSLALIPLGGRACLEPCIHSVFCLAASGL